MKKDYKHTVVVSLLSLSLICGITFAWFAQDSTLTTLFNVQKPDTITISNVGGSEMTEIDLDYIEGVDRIENGMVTIKRAITIKSSTNIHQLEIVHTTNLKSLKFNIYPASIASTPVQEEEALSGDYVNKDESTYYAKSEVLENYEDLNDVVDRSAFPLYWIAQASAYNPASNTSNYRLVSSYTKSEFDVSTKEVRPFYFTNYYLEISWKETTKETDLFYIMAQSIN